MIGMVLTIGLLGLALVLCRRSANLLEQARIRVGRLDIASLDRRGAELSNATDELSRAVDLQG